MWLSARPHITYIIIYHPAYIHNSGTYYIAHSMPCTYDRNLEDLHAYTRNHRLVFDCRLGICTAKCNVLFVWVTTARVAEDASLESTRTAVRKIKDQFLNTDQLL